MLVRESMTTHVITVDADAPLKEAARLLVEARVSGLPVIDAAGTVVGVVSEADFVAAAGGRTSPLKQVLRAISGDTGFREPPSSRVRDVMSSPARSISSEQSTTEAAGLMSRWKVNRLPVIDDGRLVGIITRADIVSTYTRSDAELRIAVEKVLRGFDGIAVTGVRNGVAVIRGRVRNRATAEAAKSQVSFVPGVIQVDAQELTWDSSSVES